MKRILEIGFVYLIGVLFILTLALRVREIDRNSVSNASIASNYTVNLSKYE